MDNNVNRCRWVTGDEIYIKYHDEEWGKPLHDERKLFEMLILEGQQAGLSWITVLKKRESYREAYNGFDPEKITKYDDKKIEELMNNSGIIRNKLKVNSVIKNAKAYLNLIEKFHSLDNFLWSYIDYSPIIDYVKDYRDAPASNELSEKISKDLKKLGFTFVGPTIIYAYMQGIGMINNHEESCFLCK